MPERILANSRNRLSGRHETVIKTVIFDLGGVIVPLDFPRGYATLEPLCGIPGDEIAKRIRDTGLLDPFERGEIEDGEFARRVCEELGLRLSFDEFREVWSSIFLPHTLIPESMIVALKRRYKVLLLSNTNSLHFPYVLEHYPLLRHFDGLVLSYESRAMKPAPKIYRDAVAMAGCEAAECFFTDDVEENVEGARREGLQAAQFLSEEQLREEFRTLGIEL